MKNILVDIYSGKGFITHADQEKNGLSFSVLSIDGGARAVVEVNGLDENITTWMNRVSGTEITEDVKVQHLEKQEKLALDKEILDIESDLVTKKERQSVLTAKEKL